MQCRFSEYDFYAYRQKFRMNENAADPKTDGGK